MPQIIHILVVFCINFVVSDIVKILHQQSSDLFHLWLMLFQPRLQIVILILEQVILVLQLRVLLLKFFKVGFHGGDNFMASSIILLTTIDSFWRPLWLRYGSSLAILLKLLHPLWELLDDPAREVWTLSQLLLHLLMNLKVTLKVCHLILELLILKQQLLGLLRLIL